MGWNYLSISKLQRLHRWNLAVDRSFHHTIDSGCNYFSKLGLKLIHVSKRHPWKLQETSRLVSTVATNVLVLKVLKLQHIQYSFNTYRILSSLCNFFYSKYPCCLNFTLPSQLKVNIEVWERKQCRLYKITYFSFKVSQPGCIFIKTHQFDPWVKDHQQALLSWWRHQMETFSSLLAICAGNSPVTGEFPAQRPVTRSFDVFFYICARINGWVNNGEAGDLRRYCAHYDVTVMWSMGQADLVC